jgi:hypothetical protein
MMRKKQEKQEVVGRRKKGGGKGTPDGSLAELSSALRP